jgi:glyoxylase-like metal-dependent hydrolase (beta-lactamase superfamily II)
MSSTDVRQVSDRTGHLAYKVFINDPPPQDGLLPNGEPKQFSPQASTLIHGAEDAVLVDAPLTADQARALGDWVAGKGWNLTDIFITHGHGDHWFTAGLLADRFGARVVATAGTIGQMHAAVASRSLLWDKLYSGIPSAPVTAVAVPDNRFTLEGHDLVMVEVGHTDSDDTTVLHVPDLELVVAGDAIYNGVHMYLGQSAVGGFRPWREAIDKVEALEPPAHRRRSPEQPARRRRPADDRGDAPVPRRRRRAPADRDHRRRLLQRQARSVPGPPGPDGALGPCQAALRRARAPRRGRRQGRPRLVALSRVGPWAARATNPRVLDAASAAPAVCLSWRPAPRPGTVNASTWRFRSSGQVCLRPRGTARGALARALIRRRPRR